MDGYILLNRDDESSACGILDDASYPILGGAVVRLPNPNPRLSNFSFPLTPGSICSRPKSERSRPSP